MRPGIKTTEFYVVAAAGVLDALKVVPTPHNSRGVLLAMLAAVYALARGIAKNGAPPAAGSDPVGAIGELVGGLFGAGTGATRKPVERPLPVDAPPAQPAPPTGP